MISAQFLWGNVLLREKQKDANKSEFTEYAFNMHGEKQMGI